MNDLFQNPEFKRYHKKLARKMTQTICALLDGNRFEEVKGARDMALKVIKFPTELQKGDDMKMLVEEVMKEFKAEFIRVDFD